MKFVNLIKGLFENVNEIMATCRPKETADRSEIKLLQQS